MVRFVFATLMVAILSALPESGRAVENGTRAIVSDYGYWALIARLETAIKRQKLRIVGRASVRGAERQKKRGIPGNMVIGAFSDDYATRVLRANVAAGIEMPIRFYVTHDPDEKTATLWYRRPSWVLAPYGDKSGELRTLGEELDRVMDAIAAEATNSPARPGRVLVKREPAKPAPAKQAEPRKPQPEKAASRKPERMVPNRIVRAAPAKPVAAAAPKRAEPGPPGPAKAAAVKPPKAAPVKPQPGEPAKAEPRTLAGPTPLIPAARGEAKPAKAVPAAVEPAKAAPIPLTPTAAPPKRAEPSPQQRAKAEAPAPGTGNPAAKATEQATAQAGAQTGAQAGARAGIQASERRSSERSAIDISPLMLQLQGQ